MRARITGLYAGAGVALFSPMVALAQVSVSVGLGTGAGVDSWLVTFTRLLNGVLILFIALAVVVFIWGLVQYLLKLGGEDGGKGGIKLMLWGVIALTVMVSVWGFVRILQYTLGIGSNEAVQVPRIPTR